MIIPSITKLQDAIDDVQIELESYKAANATVSGYGTLDMDELKLLKALRERQLEITQQHIQENEGFIKQAGHLLAGNYDQLWTQTSALYQLENQLHMNIKEVQEKIEKLECFVYDVSRYFTDSLTVLNLAIQGAKSLSQVIVDSNGNYYTVGLNMSWVDQLKKSRLRTIARGSDLKESLIREASFDLMLSEEGDAYYRKQLRAFLKDKPASEWPRLIEAFTKKLAFDDEGNILFWTTAGTLGSQSWLVLKNGEFDAKYTQRLNEEVNYEQWQHVKENALELLSGIASVIAGAFLVEGGVSLGAGGLVLALPTGGLSVATIVGTSSATIVAGGTLVVGGAAVANNAIIKIAAANATIQVSFAKGYDDWQKNKKTSITHGKQIEGRSGGKKLKIRVDSEPYSRKFQVQSGSGKSGYSIDEELRISRITGKDSIIDWVNTNAKLKKLNNNVKKQIIDRIWKAYQSYYQN